MIRLSIPRSAHVLFLLLAGGWLLEAQEPKDSAAMVTPGGRVAGVFAYDSTRDRLLLYGGRLVTRAQGVDPLDVDPSTYAWNGSAWSVVAPTGPRSRDEVAFGSDPTTGAIIAFGGRGIAPSGRVGFRETWKFEGNRWVLVDTGGPPHLEGPQGAWDPSRKRLVVFGGRMDSAGVRSFPTHTWEWDGRTWSRFDLPGPTPVGRTGHVMAYDARAKMIVLHGGLHGTGTPGVDRVPLTDTWAWTGTQWRLLSTEGPRTIFGAATTALDSGIVVYGGHRMAGSSADVWQWTGKLWRVIAAASATDVPGTRTFNMLATDPRNRRIYMIGGLRSGSNLTDMWYLDATNRWTKVY